MNSSLGLGTVAWQDFTPGTTSTGAVTVTKPSQGVTTIWSFVGTDELGQTTHCG